MTTPYEPEDWRPDPFGGNVGYSLELAYAENVTGTAQAITTTAAPIPGVVIVIQPTPQNVYLQWQIAYQVTAAANAGALFAQVNDITTSTPGTNLISSGVPALTTNVGTWSKFLGTSGIFRLGPVTQTRVISLSGILVNDSGAGLTASARNTAAAPSFLAAVAR